MYCTRLRYIVKISRFLTRVLYIFLLYFNSLYFVYATLYLFFFVYIFMSLVSYLLYFITWWNVSLDSKHRFSETVNLPLYKYWIISIDLSPKVFPLKCSRISWVVSPLVCIYFKFQAHAFWVRVPVNYPYMYHHVMCTYPMEKVHF